MKLASGTTLLGKVLASLGHLAAETHGDFAPRLLNRIHIRWTIDSVILTASDGNRACLVTLLGERAGGEPGESVIAISPQPWSRDLALHTIFRSGDGSAKVIGEKIVPIGISRTRTELDAFGLDLGHVNEEYPAANLDEIREHAKVGFVTDFNTNGMRRLQINPTYLLDALNLIENLWQASPVAEPPHVDIILPPHPHAPMSFVSHWEKTKPPLFNVEYIIMPYRTP